MRCCGTPRGSVQVEFGGCVSAPLRCARAPTVRVQTVSGIGLQQPYGAGQGGCKFNAFYHFEFIVTSLTVRNLFNHLQQPHGAGQSRAHRPRDRTHEVRKGLADRAAGALCLLCLMSSAVVCCDAFCRVTCASTLSSVRPCRLRSWCAAPAVPCCAVPCILRCHPAPLLS